MKRKEKYVLAILILAVLATFCDKTIPASFWTNFHKDLILTKNSNQGPWRKHKEIYLKSDINNAFTDVELIDYSKRKDWKLGNSILFLADTDILK